MAASKLMVIRRIVKQIPDPWVNPHTRLWEDGTYTGSGRDLIACRDAIHDIKVLLGQTEPTGEELTCTQCVKY